MTDSELLAWTAFIKKLPPEKKTLWLFSEDVGYAIGYFEDGVLRDQYGPLRQEAASWILALAPPPDQDNLN